MEAVHAGDIWWHAMPFNTQVELLDAPLLQYAIELTHELDAKFGQKPKRTMSQVYLASHTILRRQDRLLHQGMCHRKERSHCSCPLLFQ